MYIITANQQTSCVTFYLLNIKYCVFEATQSKTYLQSAVIEENLFTSICR